MCFLDMVSVRMINHSDLDSVRIDKWLWSTRKFKTRTLASQACRSGNVRINDVVCKPASKVKPGDIVRALTPGGPKILRVVLLAEKRGPASFAQTLYEDLTPEQPRELAPPRFDRGTGRPTKRDRRAYNRLRRRS